MEIYNCLILQEILIIRMVSSFLFSFRRVRPYFFIFTFFFSTVVNSQLCTGSLGDPVVNLTFGTYSNPDLNYTPSNAYTYISSSCPDDGYYTVTSSTSGCFGNAWHTVSSDHTGNGAFMLVNASYQPGDFFVKTVTGLCPNTTYEFASWIMNVLLSPSGIKPNLTFRIETPDGIVLKQYNTGDIFVSSQPEWKQYGFFFTTSPANPVIILRITNNAPGGMGNDIGLDDITFRPCGPVITSEIQGGSSLLDICTGSQQDFVFGASISPGFNSPIFQWQNSMDSGLNWIDIPGATNMSYQRNPTISGSYWYRITVAEGGNAGFSGCRIASEVLKIIVHPKPIVDAGPNRVVLKGGKTVLNGSVDGESVSYYWSPSDFLSSDTAIRPFASPDQDIQYKLSAVSQYFCTNEDYVNIKVVADIFIPTAFTPNNDGKNDTWSIPFLDPQWFICVSLFNRFGQLVYRTTANEVNWDGTINGLQQPTGTYVYIIHLKDGLADRKGTV
ncbi:MAG: gliding motility-associated C-terminal domain-containing protein, partial [Chitinophagaceae bacterium]